MRAIHAITGMITGSIALLGTAAVAAELPFGGVYGTAPGCALINRVEPIPGGKRIVVERSRMIFGDNNCTYSTIRDQGGTADGGHMWQVGISCDVGHGEDPLAGDLRVTKTAARDAIVINLLGGAGPAGDFETCAAP